MWKSLCFAEGDGAAVSSAHSAPVHPRFPDDFEDPQHFEMIDAMNDAALDTVAISVTGKDLLILTLLILNVVSLTILVCRSTKCCNGKQVKYEAVSVLSENEG